MRAFVLTTGRSGSVTFAKACSHIINYTSGHETRFGDWENRLFYPDSHIEVDHRLAYFLGGLDKKYGNNPTFVWLRRDREAVAQSWARRTEIKASMINHWPKAALFGPQGLTPLKAAKLMVESTEDNIELFLKDKTKVHEVWIEDPKNTFIKFWHSIGAEGLLEKALAEFNVRYNKST